MTTEHFTQALDRAAVEVRRSFVGCRRRDFWEWRLRPRLSGFPCKGRFRYANLNLPSNMIANCAFAMAHSRGGILHSFCARFNTRKRSFSALSSVGKWPRARTALRNLAFNDSIAFVV